MTEYEQLAEHGTNRFSRVIPGMTPNLDPGSTFSEQGTNQYRGLDPGSDPLESEEPKVIPGTTFSEPEELPEPVVTRQEVAKAIPE